MYAFSSPYYIELEKAMASLRTYTTPPSTQQDILFSPYPPSQYCNCKATDNRIIAMAPHENRQRKTRQPRRPSKRKQDIDGNIMEKLVKKLKKESKEQALYVLAA